MAKLKYYYDTTTSQFKRETTKTSDIIINLTGIVFLGMVIGGALAICYTTFFNSPRELSLSNEIREMEFYYNSLNKKVELLHTELGSIEQRDDKIYRVVLGSDPVDKRIRDGRVLKYDGYEDIRKKKLIDGDLIIKLTDKIEKLGRKLYMESLSQDDLANLTETKEKQFAAIPAIQPISNKQLIAIASGFGLRIHPVYKVIRMHTGIDFAAPLGTPVYSTADGVVNIANEKYDGYGKMIIIDHGYGYLTRYAHLQNFYVTQDQHVKRGQQIGCIGNTGLSTAPHLHYEVLLNGEFIDPVHYFFHDLTPVEYEKVLELASIQNQSLGN